MLNRHEFYFDNWDFALDNVFESPTQDILGTYPPPSGLFELLSGDDFFLLNGQPLELL